MKPSKLLVIQVDSNGTTFYHCKHCDYRSKNHTNAKVHQRIHSNHRPHVCDSCEYASNSASNLKKHLLQHTNFSFTCPHCSYSTKSKQYLKKHMRSHLTTQSSLIYSDSSYDTRLGCTSTEKSHHSNYNNDNDNTSNHSNIVQSNKPTLTEIVDIFWCSLCHVYELPDHVERKLNNYDHLAHFYHKEAIM